VDAAICRFPSIDIVAPLPETFIDKLRRRRRRTKQPPTPDVAIRAFAHREIENGHTRGKLLLIVDEDRAAQSGV